MIADHITESRAEETMVWFAKWQVGTISWLCASKCVSAKRHFWWRRRLFVFKYISTKCKSDSLHLHSLNMHMIINYFWLQNTSTKRNSSLPVIVYIHEGAYNLNYSTNPKILKFVNKTVYFKCIYFKRWILFGIDSYSSSWTTIFHGYTTSYHGSDDISSWSTRYVLNSFAVKIKLFWWKLSGIFDDKWFICMLHWII